MPPQETSVRETEHPSPIPIQFEGYKVAGKLSDALLSDLEVFSAVQRSYFQAVLEKVRGHSVLTPEEITISDVVPLHTEALAFLKRMQGNQRAIVTLAKDTNSQQVVGLSVGIFEGENAGYNYVGISVDPLYARKNIGKRLRLLCNLGLSEEGLHEYTAAVGPASHHLYQTSGLSYTLLPRSEKQIHDQPNNATLRVQLDRHEIVRGLQSLGLTPSLDSQRIEV